MNDKQIKQLLASTKLKVSARIFKTSCLGWGLTIMSTGALLGASQQALAILLGLLQVLPAAQITRNAFYDWREFKRAPAWRLWRELVRRPRLLSTKSTSSSELARSLQDLYKYDSRGEMLPLAQATRVLLIYDLQKHRLDTLRQRGVELRFVREQLLEKSARLHELGDTNLSVTAGLDEMKQELATLEQLCTGIEASCQRLETIVLSAHRAVQVKQLHREIAELKSSVTPTKNSVAQLDSPELGDIERQITREIETFLQLEQETNSHLRDL